MALGLLLAGTGIAQTTSHPKKNTKKKVEQTVPPEEEKHAFEDTKDVSKNSADGKAVDGVKNESNTEQSKLPSNEVTNSSTNARKIKHLSLGLEVTPASDYMLTYGLSGEYHSSSKLLVGASLLTGTKSKTIDDTQGGFGASASAKLTGTAFLVTGRYFFGNSFNLTSGLGYRTASINYTISVASSLSNINIDGKLEIQSIVVPLFIGNRWSWKSGFSLGCDWIGIMVPVTGSSKGSVSGTLSSSDASSINDEFVALGNSLAKQASATLLLTTLSWAF